MRKLLSLILVLLLALSLVACSDTADEAEEKPAQYGDFGSRFAVELAQTCPKRVAGTQGERDAFNFIWQALVNLGYEPEEQAFSFYDQSGNPAQSANIIVRIPGRGFKLESDYEPGSETLPEMQPPEVLDGRKIYVLAHYDTYSRELDSLQLLENRPQSLPSFDRADGLHNNAAGVAVLMTLAQQLKEHRPGYDVVLAFVGAGMADRAGAEFLVQNIQADEKPLIDCVFNLSAIYAGDKVYAHAGQNSVVGPTQKDYTLRRKLYEVTDVYYNNLLLTRNDFAIYTNQGTYEVQHPRLGVPVIYREWTLAESDHTPFDREGYPVVFFQSGQYDTDKDEPTFRESTDPVFNPAKGNISGTGYDFSQELLLHFAAVRSESTDAEDEAQERPIDLLERRINNLAFILLEMSDKAPPHCEIK